MHSENERQYTFLNSVIVTTILTVSIVLTFLTVTAVASLLAAFTFANTVVHDSGFSWPTVRQQVRAGLANAPIVDEFNHKNILILGLDSLESRPGSKTLTDTIMVASIDLQDGSIALVSIPRDVWSDNLQAKINAAYAIATERNIPAKSFVSDEVSSMTGIPIHHTVVLTLDTVAQVVDALGGVTVFVDQAFTDNQFPRPDVDVTVETDPAVLYQTVSFPAGDQHLDGVKALQYVRSRHASGTEGTDLARSARQQKLIGAVISKATSGSILLKRESLIALGRIYNTQFAVDLPISELVATSKQLLNSGFSIKLSQKPVSVYPDSPNGVLFHPPERQYQGQWVYAIRDLDAFQNELRQSLLY